MLVLSLPAFENKKYTAYDRFHGNGPYGEIPTKKETIRTFGFTLPYNKTVYPNQKSKPLPNFRSLSVYSGQPAIRLDG